MNYHTVTGLFFRPSRAGWLTSVLLAWILLLLLPLIDFTVYPARVQYLLLGREIGWKTGFFQGSRGRLLDRDGQPLVWTERRFNLDLIHLPPPERIEAVNQTLQMIFLRHAPTLPAKPTLYKSDLNPEELNRYAAVQEQLPEFRLTTQTVRILLRPELKQLAGEVKNKVGITTGVSGWELKYDRMLRGRVGFFTVMTDKHGKWISDTWQELRKPVPGQDITLEQSLDELLSGTRRERRQP